MADNSEESLDLQEWQSKVQQSEENTTGLPDALKANLESKYGMSLDHIKVHYNSSKPAKLEAHAYAKFPNIYIAPGQEKHLPEEAAHMVQQMQGRVKPTKEVNGTPVNDNASLEKEAVQEGQKVSGGVQKSKGKDLVQNKGQQGVVQRAKIEKESHYGTFSVDDAKYDFDGGETELPIDLDFEPTGNADATKVGLVQLVKKQMSGNVKAIDPNAASKMSRDGHRIDQLSDNRNPLYATGKTEPAKDANKLETYSTPDGTHATKDPVKGWTNANIKDAPSVYEGNNSLTEFETSALALEGKEQGKYYGSVKWGWERDGIGTLNKIDFDLVSMGVPSKNFMEAAKKWNDGKARGALVAKANGTNIYSAPGVVDFTIDKDIEGLQENTVSDGKVLYVKIKITSAGTHKDDVGYVKVDDMKDKGDGKETVNLPIVKTKVPTENNISLYKAKDKVEEVKKLAADTRIKVVEEKDDMAKIEIVDGSDTGKTGWLKKSKLKNE